MVHADENRNEEAIAATIANEDWTAWLRAELEACPSYAEHASLLNECCQIAAGWRARFWTRKALWTRIRRGRRFAKELAEVAPVIARVRAQVDELNVASGQPKAVILDLCSGFGYLGMLLSELLPANKVDRIVLVDKMWAPHNITRQPHHLDPEHIHDPGWPIHLSTSRADLKVPSDRRSLVKCFLSHAPPALLVGVHLCGTLSLRCVELYNDCPSIFSLALKPCCLPDILFAQRGDVFGASNGYCFPAKAVCVAGKWSRGQWVGGAGKPELESKFETWVANLGRCVDCNKCEDDSVQIEWHLVQERWFQNKFIFAHRSYRAEPPRSTDYCPGTSSVADIEVDGNVAPNTSNSVHMSEARKEALLAEWHAEKRHAKRERRLEAKSAAQRAAAEILRARREAHALRVSIQSLSDTRVKLTILLEVHKATFIRLGGDGAWVRDDVRCQAS